MEDAEVVKLTLFGKEIENVIEGTLGKKEERVEGVTSSDDFKPGVKVGLKADVLSSIIVKSIKLKFGMSDDDTDAMQSYVPYFDAHEAVFQVPSPLSSIGMIYYTNDKEYAGYVKLTIKSMHFDSIV